MSKIFLISLLIKKQKSASFDTVDIVVHQTTPSAHTGESQDWLDTLLPPPRGDLRLKKSAGRQPQVRWPRKARRLLSRCPAEERCWFMRNWTSRYVTRRTARLWAWRQGLRNVALWRRALT